MRLSALVLAAIAVLGLTACGGDDDEPEALRLDQRLVTEAEAPGSKPDPAETRRTAADLDEVAALMEDQLIEATPDEATDEFRKAGFRSAIVDTRFYGERHTREAPHVVLALAQFADETSANDVNEWLYRDSKRPCPETCATHISEFDVDGIPDATGVRRVATAERLEATGDEGEPYDSYEIRFVDGPFAYSLVLGGAPGDISEDQAADVAQALHDRVEGAPPPAASAS